MSVVENVYSAGRRVLAAGVLVSALVITLGSTMMVSNVQANAGLLTGGAKELPPLTLSVVEPLANAPYILESGQYYKIDIVCDGSGELALGGAEFFRNIWIDEIVINDIEIRPLGLNSLEFDDEGTATIKFIAIRPGNFTISIPGSTGDSQKALFTIQ